MPPSSCEWQLSSSVDPYGSYSDLANHYPLAWRRREHLPRWLSEVVSELDAPPRLLDLAKAIISGLPKSLHGRRRGYLYLASLVVASRILGTPLTLKTVSQAAASVGLRVSPKKLAIMVGEVSSACRSPVIDSRSVRQYISSIVSHLKRDPALQSILHDLFGEHWGVALDRLHVKSLELLKVTGKVTRLELAGKSPAVTAAATVWLTARTLGLRFITQERVARAAGVSSSALRKRTKLLLQGSEAAKFA